MLERGTLISSSSPKLSGAEAGQEVGLVIGPINGPSGPRRATRPPRRVLGALILQPEDLG